MLLTHRLRGFPGLHDALAQLENVNVSELPESAVSDSIWTHSEAISGRATVTHVVTLPVQASQIDKNSTPAASPTHLLLDAQAIAIGTAFRLNEDLSTGLREMYSLFALICSSLTILGVLILMFQLP